jgi:hypothetical protein
MRKRGTMKLKKRVNKNNKRSNNKRSSNKRSNNKRSNNKRSKGGSTLSDDGYNKNTVVAVNGMTMKLHEYLDIKNRNPELFHY